MAVFFGGGVWVSLDLEAAAVVVSVEGCCWRVSLCWCLFVDAGGCGGGGVCSQMPQGCRGGCHWRVLLLQTVVKTEVI